MRNRSIQCLLWVQFTILFAPWAATAWEHHPLLTKPILSTLSEVTEAAPAPATPLETFLMDVEADLAGLLEAEETWARTNLASYKPRPDALAFAATGNAGDIRDRFFKAIRVNPNIRTPLYLSPLAGVSTASKRRLDPGEVSILRDTSNLSIFDFVALDPGEPAGAADVVATASNEPDYGMDIGLFEDNGTEFGLYYGFGVQPFGNPGLDYGSQAPFHMGFYHESPLVFLFASFLKESYPEYRIHLFKSLSKFAFDRGHDYWGWRFMGWGLHYLGDLSMPYHTTALPGYSTLRMLFINLLDMLGWSTPKDHAVQLSSNRHVALETFEGIVMEDALRRNDTQQPMLAALLQPRTVPAYADSVPRARIAKASHDMNLKMDKAIVQYMPAHFVNDPLIELGNLPVRYQIVELIESAHGADAVTRLEQLQAEALSSFAIHGRGYVKAIRQPEKQDGASDSASAPLAAFIASMARAALGL